MTQHTADTAPLQQTEAGGEFVFGQASDMLEYAPKARFSAARNSRTPNPVERVRAAPEGEGRSRDDRHGLGRAMLRMALRADMPDDVKKPARLSNKRRAAERPPFLAFAVR